MRYFDKKHETKNFKFNLTFTTFLFFYFLNSILSFFAFKCLHFCSIFPHFPSFFGHFSQIYLFFCILFRFFHFHLFSRERGRYVIFWVFFEWMISLWFLMKLAESIVPWRIIINIIIYTALIKIVINSQNYYFYI